ncbi:MAG TPA: PEP/pyruvate-binding domain-containing protein [Chlamydiales bacterium]|nr:PEP/pyruvate-binding domain-containing protein [Chlamydiales bacterium]
MTIISTATPLVSGNTSLIPFAGFGSYPAIQELSHRFLSYGNDCFLSLASLQYWVQGMEQSLQDRKIHIETTTCVPFETMEKGLQDAMAAARPCVLPNAGELVKYGNKHLNLIKMAHLTDAVEVEGLNIPIPHGISTGEIMSFLERNAPIVFQKWEELARLEKDYTDSRPFLEDQRVKALLEEIQNEIQHAFSRPDAFDELHLTYGFREWIFDLENKGSFLMARSTGAEDSKNTANAGGNLSKAYIPANSSGEITKGIGEVVSSYFGPSSLRNRMNAGLNPFEEPLSLAVTLQELIGEPVGGAEDLAKIPISFVLFTTEPLYVGNEKFRAMRLSATYGHGESVVGNTGVGTDSVLILHSEADPSKLYFLYDNRLKAERLAPIQAGEEVKLTKIPNPEELQQAPALSQKQLMRIFKSGIVMEALFDAEPTDIEGVVVGNEVHFVQARPIIRKPALPTYLDVQNGQAMAATIQASPLVSGRASVIQIENADEILIADTLEEAERRYNAHKLVVVAHEEPENSHPVVNFSSLGVSCLVADVSKVRELAGRIDAAHPIAVCMQTGTLHLWDRETGNLEDAIKTGFAVHPAKIADSLPIAESLVQHRGILEVPKDLLTRIRSGEDGLEALEELEKHPQLLYLRMKGRQSLPKEANPEIRKRHEVVALLDQKITQAIVEMRGALVRHPEDRLRRLLHAKILETLIFSAPSSATLGIYSLKDVKPLCDDISTLVEYQKQFSFPSHCSDILLLGQENPVAFKEWRGFLAKLEPLIEEGAITQKELQKFKEMVSVLKEVDAFSFWLSFFPKFNGAPLEQFAAILHQMTENDQAKIGEAIELHRKLTVLQGSIDRFADPNQFARSFEDYQSLPLLSLENIQDLSPITRSIVSRCLEEKVAFLDTAAKTVKMSGRYTLSEKIDVFRKLLSLYYTTMRELAEKIVPQGAIPMNAAWTIRNYLDEIHRLMNRMTEEDAALLQPSRGFSVSAAMLGSGTAFERHFPETLEDVLTLLHQNSIACLNAFNHQSLPLSAIQDSLIPRPVKEAIFDIENKRLGGIVQRLGIEVKTDGMTHKIVVKYNVPLRNHSGHLELHYDLDTRKMVLRSQLLGQARNRWPESFAWIQDLENAGVYIADRPVTQTEQELSWHWEVTSESLTNALMDYQQLAELSMGSLNWDNIIRSRPQYMKSMILYKIRHSLNSLNANAFVRALSSLDPIDRKDVYREITNVAQNYMQSSKRELVERGAEICSILLNAEESYSEVTNAAVSLLKNSNVRPDLRVIGIHLLQRLVGEGRSYQEAFEAARDNLSSEYMEMQYGAYFLLKTLVTEGKYQKEIKELIQSIVNDPARQDTEIFEVLQEFNESL